ncbi:aminopeptidase P N-terminal domain-containing protein [Candidatus Kinetoplastidibacterium blastocrithidiae]|uniref:aminopeptidase P N-terminal domain-containing protein n=1 Tax=Candidatus Kinetoplastidibacterium blastocrithidiae TaxID=233181 RepID=UPI0009DB2299
MCDLYKFISRRRSFKQLLKNYENSITIIPNSIEHIRNSNIYYPYRSNSNFYYLTGLNEPNSCLIMLTSTNQDILLHAS